MGKTGVRPERQMLMHCSRKLRSDETLSHYGICPGSTILLEVKSKAFNQNYEPKSDDDATNTYSSTDIQCTTPSTAMIFTDNSSPSESKHDDNKISSSSLETHVLDQDSVLHDLESQKFVSSQMYEQGRTRDLINTNNTPPGQPAKQSTQINRTSCGDKLRSRDYDTNIQSDTPSSRNHPSNSPSSRTDPLDTYSARIHLSNSSSSRTDPLDTPSSIIHPSNTSSSRIHSMGFNFQTTDRVQDTYAHPYNMGNYAGPRFEYDDNSIDFTYTSADAFSRVKKTTPPTNMMYTGNSSLSGYKHPSYTTFPPGSVSPGLDQDSNIRSFIPGRIIATHFYKEKRTHYSDYENNFPIRQHTKQSTHKHIPAYNDGWGSKNYDANVQSRTYSSRTHSMGLSPMQDQDTNRSSFVPGKIVASHFYKEDRKRDSTNNNNIPSQQPTKQSTHTDKKSCSIL